MATETGNVPENAIEILDRYQRPNRRREDGVRVPPWVWAVLLSLLVQVFGAMFVTGRVFQKLDDISGRVERLERKADAN